MNSSLGHFMRPSCCIFHWFTPQTPWYKEEEPSNSQRKNSRTHKDRNCLLVVDTFLTIHPLTSYFQRKYLHNLLLLSKRTLQRAMKLHGCCALSEGHAKTWPHTIVPLFPVSLMCCLEVIVVYLTCLFPCKGCLWMCRCSMCPYIHVRICVLIHAWATKFEHRMFSNHSHSVSKITLRILGRKPWSQKAPPAWRKQ